MIYTLIIVSLYSDSNFMKFGDEKNEKNNIMKQNSEEIFIFFF